MSVSGIHLEPIWDRCGKHHRVAAELVFVGIAATRKYPLPGLFLRSAWYHPARRELQNSIEVVETCDIQGTDAIPPTPNLELMDEANKTWKAIFWASKYSLEGVLEAGLASKMWSWRGLWGLFGLQNWVLKASWHSKSTYGASSHFPQTVFGLFWKLLGGQNLLKNDFRKC